jgi:hypothetical protein
MFQAFEATTAERDRFKRLPRRAVPTTTGRTTLLWSRRVAMRRGVIRARYPTVAKPSSDHIALGGFVYRQTDEQRRYASLLDECDRFSCDYARHDRLDLAYRLARASTYLIRSRRLGQ